MRRKLLLALLGLAGAAVLSFAVLWRHAAEGELSIERPSFEAGDVVWPVASHALWPAATGVSDDEREVWRTMIETYSNWRRGKQLAIAVFDESRWPNDETPKEVHQRFAESAAVLHFFVQNTRSADLRDVALPAGSKFVPYAARASDVDAYLSLSRVGFNLRGDVAIVYVDFSCGPICGGGTYHVLHKGGGRWSPGEQSLHWIA